MAFPKHFLDRLRSRITLSEVIGSRVALKKHGREYMGLCPFHKEKSPSFTVNNEKGFYHCFGCGAHGDAISFLKDHENYGYREAVEHLARSAGLELPEYTPEQRERDARAKDLGEAMEEAANWFRTQMLGNEGLSARHYIERRKLTAATCERYRVGYAPTRREGLKTHLLAQGFNEAQLIEAGLLIRPDNGPTYDRFRGRLMFPIRDVRGNVIAFGGRLLDDSAPTSGAYMPKYLNSPETPLFHKGETLFNLDIASKTARESGTVFVVEGYMDVIMLAQAGIAGAVAALGTAMTESHIRALWQYAHAPIVCLDGDKAGRKAMQRAAELVLPMLKPDYSLKFLLLPEGEDPDSFVRVRSKQAFMEYAAKATELADTLWQSASAESFGNGPEARAALEHRLMQAAEKIADPTLKAHYRSYFRNLIWQRAPAIKTQSSKILPFKKQSSAKAIPAQNQGNLARATNPDKHICLLLKLVLLQPALMAHHEFESTLMELECLQAHIDRLRLGFLDWSHTTDAFTQEELNAWLAGQPEQKLISSQLLNDNTVLVPKAAQETLEEAARIWRRVQASYHLSRMEEEYSLFQQQAGEDFSEDDMARLMLLQSTIQAMRKEQQFGQEMAVE